MDIYPTDKIPKKDETEKVAKSYTLDALIETLNSVFGEEYCANVHRMAKAKTLYKLAREAVKDMGFIVELGAHLGFGTICLCYGAKDGNGAIVHTVDAYRDHHGWANEHYTPDNLEKFHHNIEKAGITPVLHVDDFVALGESCDPLLGWSYPVSLLVWDGGNVNAEREVAAWQYHVEIGGKIAMHDTENGVLLTDQLCKDYLRKGKFGFFNTLPGGFRIIKRIAI